MSMEAGVMVFEGGGLFWHVPADRGPGSLPDSRPLWDVFWENRDIIVGFAHSHPGSGIPGPSYTDVSTFRAIEQALGRKLKWWIISRDQVVVCSWMRRSRQEPGTYVAQTDDYEEHAWLEELRRVSYGGE